MPITIGIGTKIKWDGHSPIGGQEVRDVIWFAGRQFVLTESSMWEVEHDNGHIVMPPSHATQ